MTSETQETTSLKDDTLSHRQVFYKKPIAKDNYKLELDYDNSPQEIRRQQLLQRQKDKRSAIVNAARAILDAENSEEEYEEEPMEIEKKKVPKVKLYANKLMMSEWMLEVPADLQEKWFMLPCPKGRRNLLVASRGRTQAYSRRGEKITTFNSALPNGNFNEHNPSRTILDCIWVDKIKSYYVLDAVAWSLQPLLNCDAEFRQFWLQSRLNETPEFRERDAGNNYPILPLPNASCQENLSEFLENLSLDVPIDGLLFYHRDGHYMHGITPLVTWLKPFMLPEILGISVPPGLDEKPTGYVDLRHHIDSAKSRRRKHQSCDPSMDVTDASN